jgi:hypothetical protein
MKNSPDELNMNELLSMGKDLEDQARKVYEMSIAFAQKYEQRLENQQAQQQKSIIAPIRKITDEL